MKQTKDTSLARIFAQIAIGLIVLGAFSSAISSSGSTGISAAAAQTTHTTTKTVTHTVTHTTTIAENNCLGSDHGYENYNGSQWHGGIHDD